MKIQVWLLLLFATSVLVNAKMIKGLHIVNVTVQGQIKKYRMYCPTRQVREITNPNHWDKAREVSQEDHIKQAHKSIISKFNEICNHQNAHTNKITSNDINLHIGDDIRFGNIDAKMVRFGGYTTPECKLAVSLNGNYFYLKKVNSTCTKLTNSKGVKIICNSDKSVCKTRQELADFVRTQEKKTVADPATPSWCNASRLNKTEHMICADETLGKLDAELVKAYGAAKAHTSDSEQRAWLRQRNQCKTDIACIRQAYETRIAQLRQKNTSVNPGLARWQKQGDVVVDTKLGLMWQDNTAAKRIKKTWEDAESYCKNLTLAGYGDWYLPSYDELLTIVDYGRNRPAIMTSFENVYLSIYWSSSQDVSDAKWAWSVDFTYGSMFSYSKSDERFVRCVRHRQ